MIACLSTDHQIAVIEAQIRHLKRLMKTNFNKVHLQMHIDDAIADVERLLTKGKT